MNIKKGLYHVYLSKEILAPSSFPYSSSLFPTIEEPRACLEGEGGGSENSDSNPPLKFFQTTHPTHEREEVNCIGDEVEVLKYKWLLITESNHEAMYFAKMSSRDGRGPWQSMVIKSSDWKREWQFHEYDPSGLRLPNTLGFCLQRAYRIIKSEITKHIWKRMRMNVPHQAFWAFRGWMDFFIGRQRKASRVVHKFSLTSSQQLWYVFECKKFSLTNIPELLKNVGLPLFHLLHVSMNFYRMGLCTVGWTPGWTLWVMFWRFFHC